MNANVKNMSSGGVEAQIYHDTARFQVKYICLITFLTAITYI